MFIIDIIEKSKKEKYMEVIVKNLIDTKKLAKKFAKLLTGGEVILLNGDLGAGKTTFTKFVLKALGVKDDITSPTFTIMREYMGSKFRIYHFDMYRLSSGADAIDYGVEEYINSRDNDSIVLIEWSENIKEILSGKFVTINIKLIDEDKRMFEIIR